MNSTQYAIQTILRKKGYMVLEKKVKHTDEASQSTCIACLRT